MNETLILLALDSDAIVHRAAPHPRQDAVVE